MNLQITSTPSAKYDGIMLDKQAAMFVRSGEFEREALLLREFLHSCLRGGTYDRLLMYVLEYEANEYSKRLLEWTHKKDEDYYHLVSQQSVFAAAAALLRRRIL